MRDKCISVTDLRTKTKECLTSLSKTPKYIFVNNKPIAVLIDINTYEELTAPTLLVELPEDEITEEIKQKFKNAKKTPKSELLNIK